MGISATCPDCAATYTLDSKLAGKRVRCQKCEGTFQVELPAVQAAAPPSREPAPRPKRRGAARKEDWEDRYDGEEESRGGDSKVILWTVGIIGGVVLAVFLICGGAIAYFAFSVKTAVDNTVAAASKPPRPGGGFALPNPGPAPTNSVNDALTQLRGPDPQAQQQAARWLKGRPNVDVGRQREVAGALEALLTSGDMKVRYEAAQALRKWATPQSVPALIRLYENPGQGIEADWCRREARETLVKFPDARVARALASGLVDIRTRFDTRRALEKMGAVAETAVHPYLRHKDWTVALDACRVLQKVGTSRSVAILEQVHAEGQKASSGTQRLVAGQAQRALRDIQAREARK